jgi:hypothetical protein
VRRCRALIGAAGDGHHRSSGQFAYLALGDAQPVTVVRERLQRDAHRYRKRSNDMPSRAASVDSDR